MRQLCQPERGEGSLSSSGLLHSSTQCQGNSTQSHLLCRSSWRQATCRGRARLPAEALAEAGRRGHRRFPDLAGAWGRSGRFPPRCGHGLPGLPILLALSRPAGPSRGPHEAAGKVAPLLSHAAQRGRKHHDKRQSAPHFHFLLPTNEVPLEDTSNRLFTRSTAVRLL